MARHHVVYITDRPPINAWPVLFTIAVIFAFWKILLAALSVAVLVACLWLAVRWWRGQIDRCRFASTTGYGQHADDQHTALHRGDPYGVHGEHPPADLD